MSKIKYDKKEYSVRDIGCKKLIHLCFIPYSGNGQHICRGWELGTCPKKGEEWKRAFDAIGPGVLIKWGSWEYGWTGLYVVRYVSDKKVHLIRYEHEMMSAGKLIKGHFNLGEVSYTHRQFLFRMRTESAEQFILTGNHVNLEDITKPQIMK